ncbi:MAG TPA: metalloregulator ArsR/SmtB family transcription factor [Acidobacteriaceae bacterium]|jgi:ArsR family transcriptional regulator|nr:metalloregulator ArsR/SmtB family transcription factor [Acidobacteriaceae bacterium]
MVATTGTGEQGTGSEPVSLSSSQRMLILKALSDPRRMEIIERLSSCNDCGACSDMRECLPISAATLSHHLHELETAGLITIEREGKFAHLSLRRDVWQSFLADLGRL